MPKITGVSGGKDNLIRFKNKNGPTVFPLHPDKTRNEQNVPGLSRELKNKIEASGKDSQTINIFGQNGFSATKGTRITPTSPRTSYTSANRSSMGASSVSGRPIKNRKRKKRRRVTGTTLLTRTILLMLILMAAIFGFRKNAMAIIINDEPVGYIKAKSTTQEQFTNLIIAKLKEQVGNDIELNEKITLKPVSSLFKKVVSNPEKVVADVCERVTYKQKATSIDVQKQSYVIVSNLDTAKSVVRKALDAYKIPTGQSDPEFAIQIGTSDVFVDNSQVSSEEEAVAKLSQTQQVTKEHTVVEGDTFAQIAANAGMTETELYAANPDISSEDAANLSVGDKITIITTEPILPVRTFFVTTKTEEIPYETDITYNNSLDESYEGVLQAGVTGEKTVTTKIPYVNGEQKGDAVTKEEVTKKPVNEKVEWGTLSSGSSDSYYEDSEEYYDEY